MVSLTFPEFRLFTIIHIFQCFINLPFSLHFPDYLLKCGAIVGLAFKNVKSTDSRVFSRPEKDSDPTLAPHPPQRLLKNE